MNEQKKNTYSVKSITAATGFLPFIIILTVIFSGGTLSAKHIVNFSLGKVYVKVSGEKCSVRTGMVIPENAVIVTGKNAHCTIYNSKTGSVVNITSGKKVTLGKIDKEKPSRSTWFTSFKKNHMKKRPTTLAGVRASERKEGEEISWSDEEVRDKPDRSREWKLYSRGRYSEIIAKTGNASDDEGMFLNAASTYFIYGPSRDRDIIKGLTKAYNATPVMKIKYESMRMVALVNFETGRYADALTAIKNYRQFTRDEKLDDLTYYMLVMISRNTGNSKNEKMYLEKMNRHHPKSELTKKLSQK